MLRARRIREHRIAAIAIGHLVVAKAKLLVDDRGQGLDAVRIDLAELFDPAEDVVELGHEPLDLLIAHGDSGELGDVANLFGRNAHVGGADSRAALQRQAARRQSGQLVKRGALCDPKCRMRGTGRFHLWMWRLKLQLRKSQLLRRIVRNARNLAGDTRERHLNNEVHFWRRWLKSEGLNWGEDYATRFDPRAPIQPHLEAIVDRLPGLEVDILDVGAGPLTVVGKTHSTKRLRLTATDVLAREYQSVLDELGMKPPVATIYAAAETLRKQLGDRQFDLVYAQNSLDHIADVIAGIEEMLSIARPGGFVVLLHEENEGRSELYNALHRWDFACEHGHFRISGPGPRGPCTDITAMLSGRADVECSLYEGEVLVVIRKHHAEKARGKVRKTATPAPHARRG